jgi:hypothetical protein
MMAVNRIAFGIEVITVCRRTPVRETDDDHYPARCRTAGKGDPGIGSDDFLNPPLLVQTLLSARRSVLPVPWAFTRHVNKYCAVFGCRPLAAAMRGHVEPSWSDELFAASALRIGSHTFPHFPRLIISAIILRTFRVPASRIQLHCHLCVFESRQVAVRSAFAKERSLAVGRRHATDSAERSINSDDRECKMTSW